MFSIICPTYNSSDYIHRTISTILDQVLIPREVVFSDDGSEDDTIRVINRSKSKFINKGINIHVISNKHEGPGAARNAAIFKASEEWIAFLDADDTWHPKKLLRVSSQIKNSSSYNTFLHWENFIQLNNKEKLLKHGQRYNRNKNLSEQLYKSNFFSTSALVIKRKLLIEYNGFNPLLPNAQDYEFWLRLSPSIKLKIIPENLGTYYELKSSITLRPYYKKIKSFLWIAFKYRKFSTSQSFIYKLARLFLTKGWFLDIKRIFINK